MKCGDEERRRGDDHVESLFILQKKDEMCLHNVSREGIFFCRGGKMGRKEGGGKKCIVNWHVLQFSFKYTCCIEGEACL